MGAKVNGKVSATAVIDGITPIGVPLSPPESAILQFAAGWQEIQYGDIAQGGQLIVEVDQDRIIGCRGSHDGMSAWDSSAFLRFHPSGELAQGPLVTYYGGTAEHPQTLDPPEPIAVVAAVPFDATQVECWFERYNVVGEPCQAWDSGFGQNYWFTIAHRGPIEQVNVRQGAIPSLAMVNLFAASAEKRDVFPPSSLGGKNGTDLETFLHLTLWVRNVAYTKNVWVDVHVFDGSDARIHGETFTIPYGNSAGGNGDFFIFDGPVYQGATATPGSVSPRPDARKIQFRVYYEVNGQVFTDAILHQEEVPADAAIS